METKSASSPHFAHDLFKIVEIEINSYCNLSCSYCPNREFQRKEKGTMSLEEYKYILGQLKDVEFIGRISHEFYGEPTLHPQYEQIITLTKEALPKSKIELYSNATQLDIKLLRSLLKAGISEFIITKHENQELHEFEEALTLLKPHERERITYKGHEKIYKTNRGGSLPDIGGDIQTLLPCQLPSFLAAITLKGNVLPCFEDFFQQHEMGNIFETHIRDIWYGDKFTQFRNDLKNGLRHKYEICKGCNRIQTLTPQNVLLPSGDSKKDLA